MVEAMQAEIAELKRRLGQDSRNSSKPPSSDSPFVTPAPKGSVALIDDGLGQGSSMRRRQVQVPPLKFGFAGFRFPPAVIVVAVRSTDDHARLPPSRDAAGHRRG
jgi:hypothetical protein